MNFLSKHLRRLASRALWPQLSSLLLLSVSVFPARCQQLPELVQIPPAATALEGLPASVASSDEKGTEKKLLNAREAMKNRLLVTIVNGKFYWASRGNRQLQLHESGAFTYLYQGPGAYIKFTKIGNKFVYMEHANILLSTLTYWGEMKIITGR
ncbi:MAG: hypothetical protein AAB225_12690 [Acidobacteriota bacterium]